MTVTCAVFLGLATPASAQDDFGEAAKTTGVGLSAIGAAIGLDKLLSTSPNWANVTGMDVAGVKLGMTPEQVRAALTAKGFTPRKTDPLQDGFALNVRQEAAKRRQTSVTNATDNDRVPMFTMANGPQNEHIEVWYAATPTGAIANQIKYQVPSSRMTKQVFGQGVLAKYGKPTVSMNGIALYCTKGEPSCVEYKNKGKPYLRTSTGFDMMGLELTNGAEAVRQRSETFRAAVDAQAPADAKATF